MPVKPFSSSPAAATRYNGSNPEIEATIVIIHEPFWLAQTISIQPNRGLW